MEHFGIKTENTLPNIRWKNRKYGRLVYLGIYTAPFTFMLKGAQLSRRILLYQNITYIGSFNVIHGRHHLILRESGDKLLKMLTWDAKLYFTFYILILNKIYIYIYRKGILLLNLLQLYRE